MNITTLLLIVGAVAIVLLMHRFGHAGDHGDSATHAGEHAPHGSGAGRELVASGGAATSDEPLADGDHGKQPAEDRPVERPRKRHGCC